jgi:hypothetical protein
MVATRGVYPLEILLPVLYVVLVYLLVLLTLQTAYPTSCCKLCVVCFNITTPPDDGGRTDWQLCAQEVRTASVRDPLKGQTHTGVHSQGCSIWSGSAAHVS